MSAVDFDAVIVGGFGHAGLPLSLFLADKGRRVCAFDVREDARASIAAGKMPFLENGADEVLPRVLANGKLSLSLDPKVMSRTKNLVFIIGTPVDRHLNPEFEALRDLLEAYLPYLVDGQLIILRSTVFPGSSERIRRWLHEAGKQIEVAFCPERIAEGHAHKELASLPQIVSSFSPEGVERAKAFFKDLTEDVVVVKPIEAELAKLFTNAWRYITFAIANQFFMIANDHGADYYKIHEAMTHHYDRARGLPKPGFAAGPCLFKDTMQLGAFHDNAFFLGQSAMLVNEGLPNYLVSRLKQDLDLSELTVGILGMTFKANSDDTRESLSFKLKKILSIEAKRVLCSDVHVKNPAFVSPERLVAESDVIVIGAPHREYSSLAIPLGKRVVDVWNVYGKGCVV